MPQRHTSDPLAGLNIRMISRNTKIEIVDLPSLVLALKLAAGSLPTDIEDLTPIERALVTRAEETGLILVRRNLAGQPERLVLTDIGAGTIFFTEDGQPDPGAARQLPGALSGVLSGMNGLFRSRRLMNGIGALGILALLAGSFLTFLKLSGNFHPVIEAELYRSAQPTGEEVARYAKEHGIRSVINLRGPNFGRTWYDAEVSATRSLGIAHYDFRIPKKRDLSQAEAEELVTLMRRAEKPLLIHCDEGADRSSLASALYLAAVAKQGEEKAEDQMSFWYGHLSIPVTAAYRMDETFEELEPWLGFPNS